MRKNRVNRNLIIIQNHRANRVASTSLFCSVFGLSEFIFPFDLNGKKKRITVSEASSLDKVPLLWNITCYALCRDNNSHNYLKAFEIYLKEPVKQSAINKSLSTIHYNWMKREVNIKHLLTLAWMATTAAPPSEELAFKIFDGLGGFSSFNHVTEKLEISRC